MKKLSNMKKILFFILLICTIPTMLIGQTYSYNTTNTYYTKYFKVSSTLFKVGNTSVTESYLSGLSAKVSFPGFGTTHTTSAYGDHTHTGVYEPTLGNPGTNGYVLSSTAAGIRSWIPQGAGSMIYPTTGIALSTGSGWSTSITNNSTNWNTSYTDRLKWDGGSTGLTASTGRISLGATTVGSNLFTLANPNAISYLMLNADNSVTVQTISAIKTSLSINNVTNESKSTMFTSPTFTGVPIIPTGFKIGSTTTTITGTELNYVHNVTSSIQDQLNDTLSITTSTIIPLIFTASSDTSAYPVPGKVGNWFYDITNPSSVKVYTSGKATRGGWIKLN